jgi:hypothetical protein
MNVGHLELFLKLVMSDYNLSVEEGQVLKNRMLADDHEFERIWSIYKLKARKTRKGVDPFQSILKELLS